MSKQEFHFWCWQNCGIPKSVVAENLDEAKDMIRRMFANGTMRDEFKNDEAPGFSYGFQIVSSNPVPKRQYAVKVQVTGVNTYFVTAEDENEARQMIENDIRMGNIDEAQLTDYGDITVESVKEMKKTDTKDESDENI